MKTRIIKDGNKYIPQIKKFLLWHSFYTSSIWDDYQVECSSFEEAKSILDDYIKEYKISKHRPRVVFQSE